MNSMIDRRPVGILLVAIGLSATALSGQETTESSVTKTVSRAELLDRIYGGWVGQLIGGLEGLPHEFKYGEQPRDTLPEFTFLEAGARSDDDNDFEWPHLFFMDKEASIKLDYARIVEIWKTNMNTGIWVANKKARIEDAMQLALAAVDPNSALAEVVADACDAFHDNPDDWKAARRALDDKCRKERRWNRNSTPVNGALVCLALLYGNGDFYRLKLQSPRLIEPLADRVHQPNL